MVILWCYFGFLGVGWWFFVGNVFLFGVFGDYVLRLRISVRGDGGFVLYLLRDACATDFVGGLLDWLCLLGLKAWVYFPWFLDGILKMVRAGTLALAGYGTNKYSKLMKSKTARLLVFCNIILTILFLADYLLPGKVMPIQELDSFYVTSVSVGSGMRPAYVDRNILLLANGDAFRVGKIPEGNYQKGHRIQVVTSVFKNNITKVIFLGENIETKHVGILSNGFLLIGFIVSVIITIANFVWTIRYPNIFLIVSTMFIFIVTIGYFLS
jgi:hypothetical protein